MTPRRRRRASRASPLDNDDLLAEILLRLPPQPSCLPRVGLVCRQWRRLVVDPRFVRRFRAHHRAPPVLGFFLTSGRFFPTQEPPERAPPTLSALDPWGGHQTGVLSWRFHGCRHGLVLSEITTKKSGLRIKELMVFDPMTGDLSRVPITTRDPATTLVAVVVVAARGGIDRRSFRLVALFSVSDKGRRGMAASVYSSDSGTWVDSIGTVFPQPVYSIHHPSTLVGNAVYWLLYNGEILQFDLERQSLATIKQPPHGDVVDYSCWIMPAGDGHFGLAVLFGRCIQFLERETEFSSAAGWELCRIVQLDRVLPLELKENVSPLRLIGFAEESNVIFISADDGVFMIHLESMQFNKVPPKTAITYYVYPYSSF
ncbi:hypothetical protein ACP70R_048099 [Stipagrostis hirtigluma subsp. patula]